MNEKRIELLVKLAELRRTISGVTLCLANGLKDEEARRNTGDSIRIFSSLMEQEKLMDPVLEELCEAMQDIILGLQSDSPKISESEKKFGNLVEKKISREIMSEIVNEPYIEREPADLLFQYFDIISMDISENVTLIFEVCHKTAHSRPMQSFQYTMQLMEKYPALLSDAKYVHAGYIYEKRAQHTFEQCPVCGGKGTPYFRAFAYQMKNFSNPHLPVKLWMRCGTCSTMYTWKFAEDFLALSDQQKIVFPQPEKYLITRSGTTGTILAIWADIMNHIRRHYTKGDHLLEVGIGAGDFLAVALEMGYHVQGIEIVPENAQRVADMLKIPIWNGDFLKYDIPEKYSVIIMGDVIEHVTNPRAALKKALSILEDDGVLWLSTPNYESSFSKLHKFTDPMWMTSNHITYFSYQGFKNLAKECGFTIEEYSVSRRYNGSMELIMRKARRE